MHVLRPIERVLVGLIASSHDGLRLSVLVRLVDALDRIPPGGRVPDQPSPANHEDVLQSLGMLISRRKVAAEPALAFSGEQTIEPIFVLDSSLRRVFQRQWWKADAQRARFGMWLIAREAVRQGRCIRVFEAGNMSLELHGRDVQTLHALIASIDPDEVTAKPPQVAPDLSLEHLVLPPLDRVFGPPHPAITIRFALLQLYREDLEGHAYRLLPVLENARLRLGVLLAFFDPQAPWRNLAERRLTPDWTSYCHLKAALKPGELMAMLTSIALAAHRLQRFDLVCAAARLGEQLAETVGSDQIPPTEFLRLLRAEVDAGLLLGGNPDALIPAAKGHQAGVGVQLGNVIERIEGLLKRWFSNAAADGFVTDQIRERLIARGKLCARLGEVCHAAGRHTHAQAAFDEAFAIEQRLVAMSSLGEAPNPVLGGRGIRSFIRFSIDRAQRSGREDETTITFSDELKLPQPRWIPQDDDAIQRASLLLDQNARRLSRGRAVDGIGAIIDAAQLAMTRHDFHIAFMLLDQVSSGVGGSDPNLETMLELAAVRARFAFDAAILCLHRDEVQKRKLKFMGLESEFKSEETFENLCKYLGMPDHTSLEVAGELLVRSRESRETLERLGQYLRLVFHPYLIYALYLLGLWHAAQSRCVD